MAKMNLEEFVQSVRIDVDVNRLDEAAKALDKYQKNIIDFGKLETAQFEKVKDSLLEQKEQLEKIKELRTTLSALSKAENNKTNRKAYNNILKELKAEEKKAGEDQAHSIAASKERSAKLAKYALQKMQSAINAIADNFKMQFKSAIAELKSLTSYNSSGLYYSSSNREQQLAYGLSDSQNYAMSKSLERLGMSSYEDLFMANKTQREAFSNFMKKYDEEYQQKEATGYYAKMAELQEQFKDLKEDFQYELMDFLLENKSDIVAGLKLWADFMKTSMQVLLGIFKGISWLMSSSSASTSDVINNYAGSKSTNINMTTNVSASSDGNGIANAVNNSNRRQLLAFFAQ